MTQASRAPFAGRRHGGLVALAGVTAAAIALLNGLPLAALAVGSLRSGGRWSLDAFAELARAMDLGPVMFNSWVFALGATALSLVLGVTLAFVTQRTDLRGAGFVRACVLANFVSPPWLLAMAYVFLASPNAGALNLLADAIAGVKPFNVQSLGGMVFVSALFLFSFVFLVTEGAIAQIDASFEEAARVAGAGVVRTALTVTLPLIAPALVAAAVFSLIIAWGLFAIPAILGMPARVYVFSTQLYLLLNAFPAKYEVAAALGMVFTAISLVLGLALTFTRTALPAGRFAVVGGKGHKPAPVKLGRWRWAVGGFVATLVVLSVVLPYAVIAWMALTPNLFSAFSLSGLSLANFAYLFGEYGSLARIAGNSLALAAGESATVLAIAASAAYFVHRTRWRVGRGFGLAIYLTSLVPSVAFITGVIWAWIRAPIPLYGTLVLVGMAQAARSLPVAFRNLGDALRQIEPALEEVASTCGAGRARRFAAVTLPLVRPVLLGTFAIVFLSSMRDLNTQLFLASGTTESLTLPVVIFNFWSESRVGESAALTLVVLVLTLVVFLPVYRLVPRAL